MWLTKLTIIACLLLAMGYAKRTRLTGRPAKPVPVPETNPMESGCLAEMQTQQEFMIQSNLPRRFLVVARKGSRRMFGRTFDNVNGLSNIKIAAAGDSYNITNGISVITTTSDGAEQVSYCSRIFPATLLNSSNYIHKVPYKSARLQTIHTSVYSSGYCSIIIIYLVVVLPYN